MEFNKSNILITGGAGFIGSNVAFFLQDNFPNSNIHIFDCFRSGETFPNGNLKSFGHYKNLIGFRGNIICGNLNSRNDLALLDKYKFDLIFHFAAISDTRVYDQEIVLSTNVNSFEYFLSKAKKDNAKLIYASSAATYGSLESPQKVGSENPENPYGYSKYVMDQMANKFSSKNKDIAVIGLRYFNVYGPKEFYKKTTSSMIIQLAHQILNNHEPRLFENSENIFRDFVYIEDVVQANIKASLSNKSGVYNIGSGSPRSFKDIVDILQKLLETNLNIEYFKNPYDGYQFHTCADIEATSLELGYKPEYSLEEGIRKYLPEIKRLHNESSD